MNATHPATFARPTALLLGCLALAGCGQSVAAKHQKLIRCTGFSGAMLNADGSDPTLKTAGDMLTSKYGISAADTVPMGQAASTYAAGMDPARVTTLTHDGNADALALIAKKDAAGIADYMKSCADTYRSLGK